jgi:hypothetical protein
MDKSIAGLLGAVSALALAGPSHAAVSSNDLESALSASSYADLLKPIPNAKALLDIASAQDEQAPSQEAAFDPNAVEPVQYHHHHHHHHHHHRYYHRHSAWWYRHHRAPVLVIRPGI